MSMGTTTSLYERVASYLAINKTKARDLTNAVLECIERELVDHDRVQLTGFASFEKKEMSGSSFGKEWKRTGFRVRIAKRIEEQVN